MGKNRTNAAKKRAKPARAKRAISGKLTRSSRAILPDKSSKKEFRFGLVEIATMLIISVFIWWASPMLAHVLRTWSYAGAFLLAFLASATVFVPAGPLQFAVVMLGRHLDPWLLGIVAGVGSGLGELSGYFFGQGSSYLLRTKDKTLKWILALQKSFLRQYAGLGIFALSAIPNPFFDFAGIAAGLMGMKWYEFLLWCIAGRIVRFIVLAYLGIWTESWL